MDDGVRRITTADEAIALAHELLIPGRTWPTVVVTIAGGHDEPFSDPDEIKSAVGDLAEVVLIASVDASWAFSHTMPDLTQVYGGAGRVYPVDHAWVNRPSRSRLRFAFAMQERRRSTEQLINDALEAALAGGTLTLRSSPGLRQRTGRVAGVVGSRALVTLDDGAPATVWEELTLPGVALDRLLVKNQSVTGVYDPASRRLDLRGRLRYTELGDAVAAVGAAYDAGDVVLAEVAEVSADVVRLRLLPGLVVAVERAAVTSNPADQLDELFTCGEVVRARIYPEAESVGLRLDDIDDEDEPVTPLSLLPGGPAWLCPAVVAPEPVLLVEPPLPVLTPVVPVSVAKLTVPRRPSPLDLGKRRAAAPAPLAPLPQDAGSLEKERARAAQLANELAAERSTRTALADELEGLRRHAAGLQADLDRRDRTIEQLKTRYRKADLARQQATGALKPGRTDPQFTDPERQFRFEVYNEWAQRIPAAEKDGKPLADYVLDPGFLDSIDRIEGISRTKVVAVVVEVLTGQVANLPGRDAHQLRRGNAGSGYLTRADGATCWRVALQQNSAAARRMHYWRSRDVYEFTRVGLHDDFRV